MAPFTTTYSLTGTKKTAFDSSNAVFLDPCPPDNNPGHWPKTSLADRLGDIKPFNFDTTLDDAANAPVLNLFIEDEPDEDTTS